MEAKLTLDQMDSLWWNPLEGRHSNNPVFLWSKKREEAEAIKPIRKNINGIKSRQIRSFADVIGILDISHEKKDLEMSMSPCQMRSQQCQKLNSDLPSLQKCYIIEDLIWIKLNLKLLFFLNLFF